MTIQGAMKELVNLLNADDIPIYYKGGIKKVIETIDDYIDGRDDYVKRKTEPQTITAEEKAELLDAIGGGEFFPKTEPQTDTEIVLDPSFAELSEEQFAEAMKLIEPQTDCSWK